MAGGAARAALVAPRPTFRNAPALALACVAGTVAPGCARERAPETPPPHGAWAHGAAPHGSPSYGAAPHGSPSYGAAPHGSPSYGAAPHGSPPPASWAASSVHVAPPAPLPAEVYGATPPAECARALAARGVRFEPALAAGVDQPVRLVGTVAGVRVVGPTAPHDVLDCRLALAFHDFAAVLAAHGVVEVVHASAYRPNARVAGSGRPSQHARGLALDVSALVVAGGRRLSVLADWHGAIGDAVCGPRGRPRRDEPAAWALRSMVCAAAARGLFHLILTPNHDVAHADHWHLDLQPGRPPLGVR